MVRGVAVSGQSASPAVAGAVAATGTSVALETRADSGARVSPVGDATGKRKNTAAPATIPAESRNATTPIA